MNEVFGWFWVLLGFLSGTFLGIRFHRENWLGGYGSHPRRLLRLGHISFLGLGILNIAFACTVSHIHLSKEYLSITSTSWILGAIAMPLCCGLLAWRKGFHFLFAVPIFFLVTGVVLTLMGLIR